MEVRILFVSHSGDYYGSSHSTLDLAKGLKDRGYDCRVLLPKDSKFASELRHVGISVAFSNYVQSFVLLSNFGLKARIGRIVRRYVTAWRVRKIVKDFDPQIIYSISAAVDIGFLFSTLLGVSHIWHVREYIGLHNGRVPDTGERLFRLMLRLSDTVIFNSKTLMDYYAIRKRQQCYVYNGVTRRDSDLSRFRYTGGGLSVELGFVGALVESKGIIESIETARNLVRRGNKVSLHLFGDFFDRAIEDAVSGEEEVDIIVHGFVSDKELIYSTFDILLMLSNFEAFGRSTAEAMAYGKLVVGISNGATPELISNNKTGLLVEGRNSETIAEVVASALTQPELVNEITIQAQKYAIREFSVERYVMSIETEIERCVSR